MQSVWSFCFFIVGNLQLTGWLAVTRRLNEDHCGIPKRPKLSLANGSEIATLTLATTFFMVRMVAKCMNLGGGWGADDYTIIAAWVSYSQ